MIRNKISYQIGNYKQYISLLRHFCSINQDASEKIENQHSRVNLIPIRDSRLKLSHVPVMGREILKYLNPKDGQKFIDMTFGGGGHTSHLLSTGKKITVYALDRDPVAHQKAVLLAKKIRETNNGQTIVPLLGRFSELQSLMEEHQIQDEYFDGVIMDLGTSSMQFDDPRRGFSLSVDGPLDMRMDGERFPEMPTAADVVNTLSSDYLARIFKVYGEEKRSMKIAQVIVDARFMMKQLVSTSELAKLISNISDSENVQFDKLGRPIHAGTRVFQALRIFVNNEMNELNYGLEKIRKYIKCSSIYYQNKKPIKDNENVDAGKIAVISFHSLEDRIVKQHLVGSEIDDEKSNSFTQREWNALEISKPEQINKFFNKKWKSLTKHVVLPTEEEVLSNPRSRSAKLRVAMRLV